VHQPLRPIYSLTTEYPSHADVFQSILQSLLQFPYGGLAVFEEIHLVNQAYCWISYFPKSNNLQVELSPSSQQTGNPFPPGFSLIHPLEDSDAWEYRAPIDEPFIADLASRLAALFTQSFLLPPGFILSGRIHRYFPPLLHPKWAIHEMEKESLRHTLDEINVKVREYPEDETWQFYLAFRTPDMIKRLELASRLFHPRDRSHKSAAWQIWEILNHLTPSTRLKDVDGIKEFSGWKKLRMDPKDGNWYAEAYFPIVNYVLNHRPVQAFQGGINPKTYIRFFDEIIQLTKEEYLCRDGLDYFLFTERLPDFLFEAGQLILDSFPSPSSVLSAVQAQLPEVYQTLQHNLFPTPDHTGYISCYREFLVGWDDISTHLADGLVLMDDRFQVRPLRIQSYNLKSDDD
jgi:hypothetical protein